MASDEAVVTLDAPAAVVDTATTPNAKPAAKQGKRKAPESKTKKHKKIPSHPSYGEMVSDAIETLKERGGSSQYAITKFLEGKHNQLPPNFKKMLLVSLRKLVANGKVLKVKGSFKLPSGKPAVSKPSVPVISKKPVAAPKTGKSIKPSKSRASSKQAAASKKPAVAPKVKKTVANPKPAPAKTKLVEKPKPPAKSKVVRKSDPITKKGRPAKAAKTSAKSAPGKSAAVSKPLKKSGPVKKVTQAKKAPVKAAVKLKSVKSPAKKAAGRRGSK